MLSATHNKQILVRIFAVLFVAVLLLSATTPIVAQAAETDNDQYVELDGTFTGAFHLSSNTTDLFHLTNIAPGDQWTGTIHVKNSATATMEIAILSVISNLEDTVLFDKLITTVSVDGQLIYDGAYGFDSPTESMTPYFAIEPGKTLDLVLTVTLPRSVGNEVMNKRMDSTWTFDARYYGSSYTVRYVDKEGKDLAPRKTDYAPIGSTVTEYALDIPGYQVDSKVKKLEIKDGVNEIVFVYIRDGGAPPTGYLTQNRTLTTSMILLVVSLLAIFVTYLRARAIRMEQKKRK